MQMGLQWSIRAEWNINGWGLWKNQGRAWLSTPTPSTSSREVLRSQTYHSSSLWYLRDDAYTVKTGCRSTLRRCKKHNHCAWAPRLKVNCHCIYFLSWYTEVKISRSSMYFLHTDSMQLVLRVQHPFANYNRCSTTVRCSRCTLLGNGNDDIL